MVRVCLREGYSKNYHPVRLLSFICKVFKKLVNKSLFDQLKKFSLFSDFQYGFRFSLLTADLLEFVSDRICMTFNRSGAT